MHLQRAVAPFGVGQLLCAPLQLPKRGLGKSCTIRSLVMPGDVIVVKKRRVMLTASKQICNLDTLRGVQQQHNEEGSAVEMPTSPLDEFSELRAERDWLTARSARHRQALVAQAEREAATCGRPVGGGISALAGADVYVHGPSHSDHMAERMRYTGYFEMRNQKLAESGSKLRMGGLDTHASVYAEMSAVASASKLASGTASTLIASQSILQVSPPQIFRGVHAYFNAAKGRHSAMHLTKLLQMHGMPPIARSDF